MSMDPNILVHYNLQNDLGSTTLTNMAVGDTDTTLVPSRLNARMLDWNVVNGTLFKALPSSRKSMQSGPMTGDSRESLPSRSQTP